MSTDFYVRRQEEHLTCDFAIRIFGSEYLMRAEEFEEFADAIAGVRAGSPAIEGSDYQRLGKPGIAGAELLSMLGLTKEPIKRRKL